MFEDFHGPSGAFDGAASDRAIVRQIFQRLEERASGDLADGWAILCDRYPQEERFRLMLAFSRLRSDEHADAASVLALLERVDASSLARPAVRDLLSLARARVAASLKGPEASRFEALAARAEGARADATEAATRLGHVEEKLVEELHDRTLGDRPLAPKKPPAAVRDHDTLVATSAKQETLRYSASAHFVVGDRVEHPAFGIGVVVARRPGKVEIAFKDGRKTLVCR